MLKALANLGPGSPFRLAGPHALDTPLDFGCPRGLDVPLRLTVQTSE
jgi:hypothetical protein